MPTQIELQDIHNPAARTEAYRLWSMFQDTPSDLLRTRDGQFYLSFDAWVQCVLAFRLRPRPAHLAVRELLYHLRGPHGRTAQVS